MYYAHYFPATLIFFLLLLYPVDSYAQDYLPLNGAWDIVFDEDNEGRENRWMYAEVFESLPAKEGIEVPIAWESIEKDYEGVAFYRKKFVVPQTWGGKVIRLKFGAVNYLSELWINDEALGINEGGFTPFEFRVDEMLKVGEQNTLILRVVGPLFLSDKEIDGMKALETPQWRGGISGGIWQEVGLVATDEVVIKDVFLLPKIPEHHVHIDLEVEHTGIENSVIDVALMIAHAESGEKLIEENISWKIHGGINAKTFQLKLDNPLYWSPDHPHLYLAEIQIKQEEKISDGWTHRFGFRELTIKNKDFYLNGEKIYLKATFFEGLYPNKIAYPDSDEMIRKEIQLAKDAGFNMIRPWRRPPSPRWLDLADSMGVLVVGSPALECMQLPVSTPYLPMRVENEVRRTILRDRNHSCIVQWELFNELHRSVLKQMMRPMAMLTRQLDPSRLILDESGGWAYGANMYLPYEHEPTKFNDIHNYPGPFINQDRYEGFLSIGMSTEEKNEAGLGGKTPGRNVVPGLMSYVSELGYGSLPNLVRNIEHFEKKGNPLTPAYRYHKRIHEGQINILEESGFSYLYPDMQQFYLAQQEIHGTANKRMIEAVRANPEVDGYCIHALVAGDWILGAGLLDLWRNPKSYAYEATKAANQDRILSIRALPRNIYAEKGTELLIMGMNDKQSLPVQLEIEILSKKGKKVWSKSKRLDWKSGVGELLKEKIDTDKWKGNYSIIAKIKDRKGDVLTENSYELDAFQQRDIATPKTKFSILSSQKSLANFLRKKGIMFEDFATEKNSLHPLILAADPDGWEEAKRRDLLEQVKAGRVVLIIDEVEEWLSGAYEDFPFRATAHPSVGLWTCIAHLLRSHPIFEGLPSDTMMRDIYENVWARKTLRDLSGKSGEEIISLGASMGFDWFSKEHKMHYSGPGNEWWGADVAEAKYGKGKFIFSQLRIIENLGKDPVADKLLFNMIHYAAH
ncbi:MAG: sugar-binding domain-containing protein [Bacteroidota bacterium]